MNKMKIKRYNLFLFLFEQELFLSTDLAEITENQRITLTKPSISSKPIIFTLQVYDVFSFFKTCFYLKISTAKIHIFYRLFYNKQKSLIIYLFNNVKIASISQIEKKVMVI